MTVLTEEQRKQIPSLVVKMGSQTAVALHFGVSRERIRQILNRHPACREAYDTRRRLRRVVIKAASSNRRARSIRDNYSLLVRSYGRDNVRRLPESDAYAMTSDGKFWSLVHDDLYCLTLKPTSKKLLAVSFIINGRQTTRSAILLLAEAFLPRPSFRGYPTTINGDHTDLRIENIEWRRRIFPESARAKRSILSYEKAKEIRELAVSSPELTLREIGEAYGVHTATVSAVINNRTWRSE